MARTCIFAVAASCKCQKLGTHPEEKPCDIQNEKAARYKDAPGEPQPYDGAKRAFEYPVDADSATRGILIAERKRRKRHE